MDACSEARDNRGQTSFKRDMTSVHPECSATGSRKVRGRETQLMESLANNHPFVDGNKRTAFGTASSEHNLRATPELGACGMLALMA